MGEGKKVVEIVKKSGKEILVIGNGMFWIWKTEELKPKNLARTGIVLGRAIFGNLWKSCCQFAPR